MQKNLKNILLLLLFSVALSSCYTYTTVVGDGAQSGVEVVEWNHYFIYGLAPGNVSDARDMAEGAEDYTVVTKHTFVNGLVAGITFGIYTPTTTIVQK